MLEFADSSTWANLNNGMAGRILELSKWPGEKMWGEALIAGDSKGNYSWADGTAHDLYYTAAAKSCKAAGISLIRLGWEFQYLGPYGQPNATDFIKAWKKIWTLYNAVAPGFFRFIFNPNPGPGPHDAISAYYPGKQYVGLVGIDLYAAVQGWAQVTGASWNVNDVVNFAVANRHDIAVPEWGLTPTSQSGWTGSGDSPQFVDDLFTWASNIISKHDINVYLLAWGDGYPSTSGTWGVNCFPKAFAELKAQVSRYRALGLIV